MTLTYDETTSVTVNQKCIICCFAEIIIPADIWHKRVITIICNYNNKFMCL